MTRSELAVKVNGILVELCGEQFHTAVDDDGDVFFGVSFGGVVVGLLVESLGEEEALLAGHHVVGVRVEDEVAAAQFVARRNQQLRIGRVEMCGKDVVFFHHLFESGVNKHGVRHLLRLLASESRSHADLAAATGALRMTDLMTLDNLGEA